MRLFSPSAFIASFLIFSSVIAAPLPNPAKKRPHDAIDDGAPAKPPVTKQPQDAPLPGRTGTSINKDGVVTGHYGDDYLPEHMRHVQDNQKEFPQNKGAFQVNPDAKEDRKDKVGGSNVRPGPDPVTGVGRVKDEKPLASQQLGPGNPGTTWQALSHEESGGAGKGAGQIKLEEDAKKDWEKKNPGQTYVPPLPKAKPELPEGSQRTEAALAAKMKVEAEKAEKLGYKDGGKTKVTDNPAWQPLKTKENSNDPQLRAHEAPAVMKTQEHHGPDPKKIAGVEGKLGDDEPARKKQKVQKEPKPPPTIDPDSMKGRLRGGTQAQAKEPPKEKPKGESKPSDGKYTSHPNYREGSRPKVPEQYKPDDPSKVGISPPKEDPNRLPNRPQDRVHTAFPTAGPPRITPVPQNPVKDDSAIKKPAGPFSQLPKGESNMKGVPEGWKPYNDKKPQADDKKLNKDFEKMHIDCKRDGGAACALPQTNKKGEGKKEIPKSQEPKKETPKSEPVKPAGQPQAPKPEPGKEASKPEPKKETPKPEPKKEAPKPEPKKEAPKPEPKKEAPKPETKEAPKPEPKKEAPKPEPKKEAPKPDPKKEAPKPEPKKEAPKPDPKKEAPKPEPKKEAPKPEPKKEAPKPAPKKEAPKPETKEAPKPEPKKAAPKPEPKKEAPKPEPKKEAPKPVPKPEPPKPAAPKPAAPAPAKSSGGKKKGKRFTS